jgi:MFS family permease
MGLLWGYPFFVHGQNTGQPVAGLLLSLLVVTMMLGGPLIGGFIARNPWQRSTLVISIVVSMMVAWATVLLWPGDAPLWLLVVLVITTGLGGPGSMVGFDVARTFVPAARLGSATGIVNVGGFLASLLMVLAIGVILDVVTPGRSTDYSEAAWSIAMSVQFVGWFLGGAMIWRYRKRARAHLERTQPEAYQDMTGRPPDPTR